MTIFASEIFSAVPKDEHGWQKAPAGLSWIKEGDGVRLGDDVHLGNYVRLGDDVHLGNGVRLGNYVRLGNGATDVVPIGRADGYEKVVSQVKGVAYIGSGCRWFTLSDALTHWDNHKEDRTLTMCLLESAIVIAKLRGWSHS